LLFHFYFYQDIIILSNSLLFSKKFEFGINKYKFLLLKKIYTEQIWGVISFSFLIFVEKVELKLFIFELLFLNWE